MGTRSRSKVAILGLLGVALPALASAAATEAAEVPPCHAAPEPAAAAPAGGETKVTLVEAPLVDSAGKAVGFPGEVLGDGIVVMNFVFTSCTTVCPVLSGLFGSLQDRLGEKLGSSVRLVSLSVDPGRDTPARLAAMAERSRSRDGWSWITGERQQVERVLRGLGAYVPSPADHAPMVLVADVKAGRWYRLNGFPTPEALEARVSQLLADRIAGVER